ncbi:hypothetical protein ANN_04253 [Periplaneta americana]|uniref:Uncharacterized protein n=1 Tax=Periplaneta americana TaxID=6978 RepID=A0ABQ8T822_PERAM|nr:hypothetical protein ANN_04253 [Periplaneta americana]
MRKSPTQKGSWKKNKTPKSNISAGSVSGYLEFRKKKKNEDTDQIAIEVTAKVGVNLVSINPLSNLWSITNILPDNAGPQDFKQNWTRVKRNLHLAHNKVLPDVHVWADAVVEQVKESFVRSPRKSTRRASRETGIPQPTVWRILRRRLHLKPYQFTMVQHITDEDKMGRRDLCVEMFSRIEEDKTLLNHVIFSDESTFHVTGFLVGGLVVEDRHHGHLGPPT